MIWLSGAFLIICCHLKWVILLFVLCAHSLMQGRLLLSGLVTMVLSMCLLFPIKERYFFVCLAGRGGCTNPSTQYASQLLKRLKVYFCHAKLLPCLSNHLSATYVLLLVLWWRIAPKFGDSNPGFQNHVYLFIYLLVGWCLFLIFLLWLLLSVTSLMLHFICLQHLKHKAFFRSSAPKLMWTFDGQ